MIRVLGTILAICLLPIAASAQSTGAALDLSAADQSSQGPMIVERIHNGFLAAPDFKATEVDKKTLGLAGGYAGIVFADAFFIGAGGYGTFTHTSDRDLAYGGLIMQWFGRTNETLGYSAKMLVGAGTAESSDAVQVLVYPDRPIPVAVPTKTGPNQTIPILPVPTPTVMTQTVRFRQDIVVFEPEVSALVRISRNLRLTAGAGYRFTGSGRYGFDAGAPGHSGPGGAVGSIGLQIVGGS